ncbi:MAG: hypothetical protein K1V96_08890 [Lachnospiraceae bacterium]
MNKNQVYIEELKIEEVPWNRITTAYGRATDFPQYFAIMWEMKSVTTVKDAFYKIARDIEHQSTLWHSTAFALIFLVKIFKSAVNEMEKNKVARFLVEQLLDFFAVIAECAECSHDIEILEHEKPLPLFSNMLDEQYLWPEDDENDEDLWDEDVFPDDLCYSFYYYSYQTIMLCKESLEELKDTDFSEKVERLQGLLV